MYLAQVNKCLQVYADGQNMFELQGTLSLIFGGFLNEVAVLVKL